MQGGKRQGAGRKPVADQVELLTVRLPKEVADRIPTPKAAWIRALICAQVDKSTGKG